MTHADEQPQSEAHATEVASPLPQPGAIFDGKYRIERRIGQGAMAVVLEATHLKLDDHVAIKLLLPQWASLPELVERFMREGRAATRIRSEHVVRVFDVGVVDAQPYLVMEYLDGSDLDHVLEQDGPLQVALAIDYLLQACEAIAEAHVHGVIHRDLKPANLFLTHRADDSACVKVLDFGISKATESVALDTRTTAPTTVMGSPHYMSPEQMVSSTDVDARSDLWALGAILHELLVGSPAFNGETIAGLSASVLRDAPPPLTSLRSDVPAAVEAVVLRCLEKDPSRRFANVAELAWALADFGSASARASAERIARVLDGGTGALSMPIAPATERSNVRASLLAGTFPPARARARVLGYVVAAIALAGIGSGIAWMVVRDERAMRAAREQQVTETAVAAPAPAPTSVTTTNAKVTSASAVASAAPSAPPAITPPPALHAATHARGPRRAPHAKPRGIPPLPDFPVPSIDPQGEPSSRPVLVAPPAPAASTPALTALPAPSSP